MTNPQPRTGEPTGGQRRLIESPLVVSALLTAGYTATAIGWLVLSALLLWADVIASQRGTVIVVANGAAFVIVTSAVLFSVVYRYLVQLKRADERFVKAQEELRQKDLAVRQGYVDVLDAVTGGKLILLTPDELTATLGEQIVPPQPLSAPSQLSDARRLLEGVLHRFALSDTNAVMLGASEALTNAIKHGVRAEYSLYQAGHCLQFAVRDFGPGIDFRELPKATLIQGFSTTSTLGLGFTIMLEIADRVLLTTDSSGTVVVLEIEFAAGAPAPPRSLEAILSNGDAPRESAPPRTPVPG